MTQKPDKRLRYDIMTRDALLGVIRGALAVTAKDGLPGKHHFYISFRTDKPGVELSDTLRGKFPEEMNIVLQNRFEDLQVGRDKFSVVLSFDQTPEKLTVPFKAITSFHDPSVKFGLQFESRKQSPGKPTPGGGKDDGGKDDDGKTDDDDSDGANVISLDSFRKKS